MLWWLNMKKPNYISHYLVLKDLIDNVDVRKHSDSVVYLTSRIENIKRNLVKQGLRFDEKAIAYSKYSHYKPYVLEVDCGNIEQAKELLKVYATSKVLAFLDEA